MLTPGKCGAIGWTIPIDNTTYRIYTAARVLDVNAGSLGKSRSKLGGMDWKDMTEEEHQKYPGDWEAQVGQGSISYHSQEHLGASDKGIIMLRKFLREQMEIVYNGGDPVGVTTVEGQELIVSEAGNWFEESSINANK